LGLRKETDDVKQDDEEAERKAEEVQEAKQRNWLDNALLVAHKLRVNTLNNAETAERR
jgi:hypothetical protein